MKREIINPEVLGSPRGYSNGVLLGPGSTLFVAGQVGWNEHQRIVDGGFAAQFVQALRNVVTIVLAAGGTPEDIGQLTIYVCDRHEYVSAIKEVGAGYRSVMERHYPAMALVEVSGLLEPGARVEIEATAVIPEASTRGDLPL
ncbi:MAG TPA: RidA family protein [Blastocatellia bacterium]|nr:RidA family protein [Blastocatellia bacterium]